MRNLWSNRDINHAAGGRKILQVQAQLLDLDVAILATGARRRLHLVALLLDFLPVFPC